MPCNDCSRAEDCPPCVNEPKGSASSSSASYMCHCGHPSWWHDEGEPEQPCAKTACGCAAMQSKDSLPRGGAEGVHVHEWGEWKPDRLMRIEYAYCDCGASKARKAEPEKCYCGCAPGAHMGKPTGCLKHGFHEFIRASWVPGADPDAPTCATCEHAQGGHPKWHGGHCVGWSADGKGCGCDGYEPEKPLEPVCTHCQGPHALEDCKGLEEPEAGTPCTCSPRAEVADGFVIHADDCDAIYVPDRTGADAETAPVPPWAVRDDMWRRIESEIYEWRERTALWGESDGITQSLADLARRAVEPADIPRRPPYAVAYAVEGGAQYEVAVSGDATVVAEDGALMVLHPKKPVLAIVRIQPMNMEES